MNVYYFFVSTVLSMGVIVNTLDFGGNNTLTNQSTIVYESHDSIANVNLEANSVLENQQAYMLNPIDEQESLLIKEPKLSEVTTSIKESSLTEEPTPMVEPTPTGESTSTVVPTPTEEPTPTVEPTPTEEPTPTVEPTPTEEPTPTVEPTPTPTPTVKPKPVSATLDFMSTYNYIANSVTGLSKKLFTQSKYQSAMKPYGKFTGKPGMPYSLYKDAMNYEWTDLTVKSKEVVKVTVDLKKQYPYNQCVAVMKKLSRHDGVNLYKIGESGEGRDMLALEIDLPSKYEKKTIILTGSMHAREGAGSVYILKQLSDLLNNKEDKTFKKLLSRVRIVAVPLVNPDGREALIQTPGKYTLKNGQLWKGYTNGTDGNRNFPGVQWGQVLAGYSMNKNISTKPDGMFYAGDFAGNCMETQAMMKFLYHYIVVEKAVYYFDYHQQGRIAYAGKPWQTKAQRDRCKELANSALAVLNKKNSKKYSWVNEVPSYGLSGEGSTLTDYAVALATGAKFSPAYGFMVYVDQKEIPLIAVKNLGTTKYKIQEANSEFATMTYEIGSGSSYLGYSKNTRELLAKEYEKYHFDQVLIEMMKTLL